MIQKKICMLGAAGVGKTSLVSRFVKSMFFEDYHSTIGVKVDRKSLSVDGVDYGLLLWDLAGEDEFVTVQDSYLRGTAGCLLVVDGTRPQTLDTAIQLRERAITVAGPVPFVLVLNKADLTDTWALDASSVDRLVADGLPAMKTSAKTGDNVEAAFVKIVRLLK